MELMNIARLLYSALLLVALLLEACSTGNGPSLPSGPTIVGTANSYILPNAPDMGPNAFGDKPLLIRRGERLRFWNVDVVEHDVVADSAAVPEFRGTGILAPGQDASFDLHTAGSTRIHCAIHPQMTGTLIVEN